MEIPGHRMRRTCSFLVLGLVTATLFGQSQLSGTIQATGNATLSVKPDQATLDAGVITSGASAQDAAQQNATQTTAVLNAITGVLGAAGTIQTVSYSVTPRYSNTPNQTPTIIGYTVTNTLRMIIIDLSLLGKLIDAANAAGANNVGNLNFGLQDPEPTVQKALGQASKQAMAHVSAIAGGLGAKTGAIVSAQQASAYAPLTISGTLSAGATTPVQTGTVNVYATVTVSVQLAQ